MKSIKKLSVIALCLILILALAGCGGGAAEEEPAEQPETGEAAAPEESEPVELVFAYTIAPGSTHPYAVGVQYCIEEYNAIGDGSITFNEQGGGVLGGEKATTEATLLGDIDISITSDVTAGEFFHELWFSCFPGVFENYDEVRDAFMTPGGWAYEECKRILEENGLVLLGMFDNGYKVIANNVRPVENSSDMKGIKIRTPEVQFTLDVMTALGALPTTIPITELTSSLQQGVVDGSDVSVPAQVTRSLYEFQKYYTDARSLYSGSPVVMNAEKFYSLSERQQNDLLQAFAAGGSRCFEYGAGFVDTNWKIIEDYGCEVTSGSDELKATLKDIGMSMVQTEPYNTYFSADLIEKMYPEI